MNLAIHLVVHDADKAASWYCDMFGFAERTRLTLPDGRLIDVQLVAGEVMLVLADEFPDHGALSPRTTGQTSAVFYRDVTDLDAELDRLLAAGAHVHRPPMEWFTGQRDAQIVDPFGHRWGIAQRVRDVDQMEAQAAAAQVFGR